MTADQLAGLVIVTAERPVNRTDVTPVNRTDVTAAIIEIGYTVLA